MKGLTLAFTGLLIASCQAQDITGIQLGMSMSEVQGKLPPGFERHDNPKVRSVFFSKNAGNEGAVQEAYTIQEANGKTAFIRHEIILPSGQEVDFATYSRQFVTKYGPESKNPQGLRPDGASTFNHPALQWQWDSAHKPIDLADCPATAAPVAGLGGGATTTRDGGQLIWEWKSILRINPVLRNSPNCYTRLTVLLGQHPGSNLPATAVNHIVVRLFNEQPYLDDAVRALSTRQQQEQQRREATEKRTGPPM